MDINMTREELLILNQASGDILFNGKTDKKCPRCGNEIIIEEYGSSYVVRCKTDGCIKLTSRGI